MTGKPEIPEVTGKKPILKRTIPLRLGCYYPRLVIQYHFPNAVPMMIAYPRKLQASEISFHNRKPKIAAYTT